MTTIPNVKFDTRLSYWRKILQKYQNQSGANPLNNLNFNAGLRRVHVKVLKAMTGSQANPYNPYTVRRLEALMLRTIAPNASPVVPGPPPPSTNGLLNGLLSYWIMGEAAGSTRADKFGVGNLTDHASNIPQFVSSPNMPNLGGIGAGSATQAAGKGLQAASTSAYSVGIGNSFTMSGWLFGAPTLNSVFFSLDSGLGDGNYGFGFLSSLNTTSTFYVNDNGTEVDNVFNIIQNGWQYITIGYNAATKQSFSSVNAGTRQFSNLTTGVKATTAQLTFFNTTNFGEANTNPSGLQDWGYWTRVLSPADVSTLYGSGSGFPFSSFQH